MDESELTQSLEIYRAQLAQVEQAIVAANGAEDLMQLKHDLEELISLTEGSLLSLKKSELLKSLEEAESLMTTSSGNEADSDVDEYKAFQAALQDVEDKKTTDKTNMNISVPHQAVDTSSSGSSYYQTLHTDSVVAAESDRDSSSGTESENEEGALSKGDDLLSSMDEELSTLVGLKCRAPHSHDWGRLDYHNALIVSARKDPEQEDQILVKVMFTTPTHSTMLPCKFYLDGHCRFPEKQCRYSHGHEVRLEQLREFMEADHSTLVVGMKCLAQYSDKIWYAATITDIKDDVINVHFDEYGEDLDVDITQVVPSENQEDGGQNSEDDDQTVDQGEELQNNSDGDGEELPVFLWRPPQSTAAFGEWEAHTRGIGSKLMARMGYVVGEGLGPRNEGKAEPVPIMLLPQGKSLDRIMELKEIAGNSDLFDAMKKLERQQKKADRKREEQAAKVEARMCGQHKPANVFDFINRRLHAKRGDLSSLGTGGLQERDPSGGHKSTSDRRHISEHELHKKTDRDINVQMFKTHEEIRNVERSLGRLREALARNENRDRGMASQLRTRLAEQEAYLATLQSSSSALEKHQQKRSDYKKLAIF